jgi:hypothetical protein
MPDPTAVNATVGCNPEARKTALPAQARDVLAMLNRPAKKWRTLALLTVIR